MSTKTLSVALLVLALLTAFIVSACVIASANTLGIVLP